MEESINNFDVIPWGSKLKIEYSEQDLQDIALEHNWKGDGTKGNPYIIENMNELADMFCIKKSNLYIIIKKSNFKYLYFISCQNISIENCSFLRLTLRKCQSIRIETSIIINFILGKSKNNIYSNCTITRELITVRSKVNNFQNCKLESKEIEYESKDLTSLHISFLKFYPFIVITVGGYIFYTIYRAIYEESSLDIIDIMFIIGFMMIIIMGIFLWYGYSQSKRKLSFD